MVARQSPSSSFLSPPLFTLLARLSMICDIIEETFYLFTGMNSEACEDAILSTSLYDSSHC